jgi:hypothetical protein
MKPESKLYFDELHDNWAIRNIILQDRLLQNRMDYDSSAEERKRVLGEIVKETRDHATKVVEFDVMNPKHYRT